LTGGFGKKKRGKPDCGNERVSGKRKKNGGEKRLFVYGRSKGILEWRRQGEKYGFVKGRKRRETDDIRRKSLKKEKKGKKPSY